MTEDRPALWQVIELRQISLTQTTVRSRLKPEALPDKPPTLVLDVLARGNDLAETSMVEVIATVKITGAEEAEPDPLISIEAEYRVLYSRPENYVPTAEQLDEFAKTNGVFNVWPYWREFTHSLYGRMDLPFPPMPVFRLGGAGEQEDGDGQSEQAHP